MTNHDETIPQQKRPTDDDTRRAALHQPDRATNVVDKPGSASQGLLDSIQERVNAGATQQKVRAADSLGGVADAFRHAGDELRSTNETLASYADWASDSLRQVADHVRERGVSDMVDDLQQFARRRPGLFIGGAFLVGLGVARFLKSAPARRVATRHTDRTRPWSAPPPVPGTSSAAAGSHVPGPVS